MLLNEFLKEHRKVETLETTVVRQQADFSASTAQQERAIEKLTAALQAQAAQIQKVSDQLGTSAPDLRTVANN